MSAIIKANDVADHPVVKPLSGFAATAIAVSRRDDERDALRRRITALERDVRQRDDDIQKLRGDVERSFKEGTAQGKLDGLKEAADRQNERLSLLEAALRQAQTTLSTGISSLDRLSALLAHDCLDKILGDSARHADHVSALLSVQLGKIDKAMLIDIRVSRADFPHDAVLDALTSELGLTSIALMARSDVPSGGCVMTLRLGQMEIGVNQQWGVLREALANMALPESTA